MTPYILLYFTIGALAFDNIYFKKNYKYGIVIVMILLGIFSGSRVISLGGYDTHFYRLAFEHLPTELSSIFTTEEFYLISFEKGYLVLSFFFKELGLSFNEFLLVLGIITSFLLSLSIKRYSKYYFLFVLIFLAKGYLYYFFTAQRQIIAMVICWYALRFVDKRQLIPFLLLCILASQFHTSALVFIIIYYVSQIKITNKVAVLVLIASFFIGVSNLGLLFGTLISDYLPGEVFSDKLNNYVENSSSGINVLNFIEMIPIYYIILSKRTIIESNTKYFNTIFILFLVFYCLTFAFYNFNIIARVKGYFIIGYILMIINLISVYKQRDRLFILLLVFLYCLVVFIRELLVFDNGEGYLPYESFLF
ncbi:MULTISPECIES: EpsG family protein [unclassified Empedobacter]|uniref:EpsG family protein n=1 Tax=unclassified Empedobacter TaxID=2643773 RepID=UPI0025BAF1A9|nr:MULTISPECIES: EpsG family protein [unclassified Empedobacter]